MVDRLSPHVLPVILAGGSGTRLWPLSRALHPKQFIPLSVGQRPGHHETLFQQAALRVAPADGGWRNLPPCVVAREEQRFTVVDQLRIAGVIPGPIILEPQGRNTAPALTLAALVATSSAHEDPVMVVAPADHAIQDTAAFEESLLRAIVSAGEGHIVVLGVPPDRPDTGYGYIRTAPAARPDAVARVEAFVEKPDLATARTYVKAGNFHWNSGMFILRSSVWLAALERFRPDIASSCRAAFATGKVDGPFHRFDLDAFAAIPAESIDYAVMEPASLPGSGFELRMVSLQAGWSDLGSWGAVWQAGVPDPQGNVVHGDAIVRGSSNVLVEATSRLVAAIGLENVTIVETPDAVLVAASSRASEVKEIAAELAIAGRHEASVHRRVHRPWGWYESIDRGPRFQVKRIQVHPGAKLSLQLHHHRAEHWIVVSGTAEVTNGDEVVTLRENQSTFIPLGQKHRLANHGSTPLEIIEVQSGDYLGEDDIVRFEDNYGRS